MENNESRMTKPQFKLSQSFSIREGWLSKAYRELINANGRFNVFSKSDGPVCLGIGSNMVSALRYWMECAGLLDVNKKLKPELSEEASIIFEADPYLLKAGSWQLIHANIVASESKAPLFYFLFNEMLPHESFSKETFIRSFGEWCAEHFGESPQESIVSDDLSVLVRTYVSDPIDDPENNLNCPLSAFSLLERKETQLYQKKPIDLDKIEPYVFYYLLLKASKSHEDTIDSLLEAKNGPGRLFNLNRDEFMTVLDRLKSMNLINVVRTAGLNVVEMPAESIDLRNIVHKMEVRIHD